MRIEAPYGLSDEVRLAARIEQEGQGKGEAQSRDPAHRLVAVEVHARVQIGASDRSRSPGTPARHAATAALSIEHRAKVRRDFIVCHAGTRRMWISMPQRIFWPVGPGHLGGEKRFFHGECPLIDGPPSNRGLCT